MVRRILFTVFIITLGGLGLIFWWRAHLRQQSAAVQPISLTGPVQILKLKPDVDESLKHLSRNDAAYFHSWPILETHSISDADALRLASILNDPQTYGTTAEKCFEPEWAIRPSAGSEVLLSVKCGRIHLINKNNAQITALSPNGMRALSGLLGVLSAPDGQK